MYNYLEAMKEDVKERISENCNSSEYANRDEYEEALYDDLWVCDSVTGNASGSYTFNSWKAKEYVIDNIDLLREMCLEFGIGDAEIGKRFRMQEWEWFDVSIRCYLLGRAISDALDEMEDELAFADDEDEGDGQE